MMEERAFTLLDHCPLLLGHLKLPCKMRRIVLEVAKVGKGMAPVLSDISNLYIILC
jgi:hypothetical protein